MNAPVGVLAVIVGASHALRNGGLDYQPMIDAHATVAELIEAAGTHEEAVRVFGWSSPSAQRSMDKLRAAIARCGGAK